MPKKNIHFLFFFIFMTSPLWLHATHNRAGEISVSPIGECTDFSVEAIITTYTKESSQAADRDSLEICWGDGTCEMVMRSNGPGNDGEGLGNDTKKNLYIATHTYTASGTYTISMTDPNRNGGILNVNAPNSDTVPFHIQTSYTFLNCQFDGPNSTPMLLQPPIDVGCVGQPFIHNPNPVDPDGDSLSFEMITPLQSIHTEVPNYLYPNFIGAGPGNSYSLDPITGDFLWTSPQIAGEYNIAMIIISWRDGEPIDTMVRDMQILIENCNDNQPPTIDTEDYICVVAGQTLSVDVFADDPNPGDNVLLTALGGPLEASFFGNASFDAPLNYTSPIVEGTFEWNTLCEHISDQPYFIVFKALDDNGSTGLANLKTLRIKVVGPAPENVETESVNNTIRVTWDLPYICEDAEDDYFYGFSVWRKIGSNQFQIDTCETGLDGKGYERVIGITNESENGKYIYIDNDVGQGKTYCYRIIANFAKLTNTNFPQPYNLVESLPSNESCVQLNRDVPLMTNVDVSSTDLTSGTLFVRWTRPVAEDLDTLLNPGPYTYELLMAEGINGTNFFPTGFSATADTYSEAIDTFTTVENLNTTSESYRFKVNFFTNGNTSEVFGSSNEASSVFLSIQPSDESNLLNWDFDVPWDNIEFTVFKETLPGVFDSIATTEEPSFLEEGLVNGRNYCYFIRATGDYGVESLDSLLINRSQIACASPIDLIAPCPPMLEVSNICDEAINCVEIDLFNQLEWNNPNFSCEDTDDVVAYNIYFKDKVDSDYALIETIGDPFDTLYLHAPEFGLAGCYAITAIDSFANESTFSNEICVDNCPRYELPNAFTPNGDGDNDIFIPYPYCFIDRIEIQIFNRWGELVFQSMDPNINWDGTNQAGDELPVGTYYYKCRVFEDRVNGIIEREDILSGYIDLFR